MNSAASINSLVEHHDALPAGGVEKNLYKDALLDVLDDRNRQAQQNLEMGIEPLTENPANFVRIGAYPVRTDIAKLIEIEVGSDPTPEGVLELMQQMKALIADSESLDVEILAWEVEAALRAMQDEMQGVNKPVTNLNRPVDENYGRRYGSTGANGSVNGGLKNPKSVYNPN